MQCVGESPGWGQGRRGETPIPSLFNRRPDLSRTWESAFYKLSCCSCCRCLV